MKWDQRQLSLLLVFLCCTCIAEDVRRPPKIVKQNTQDLITYNNNHDNITLICEAEGSGTLGYEWYKDNNELLYDDNVNPPHEAGTFIITKANRDNDGFYQCFVSSGQFGKDMSKGVTLATSNLDYFPSNVITLPVEQYQGLKVATSFIPENSIPRVTGESMEWLTADDQGNTNERPVIANTRINVDAKGNLYFAYVLPSDQATKRKYVMSVRNSVMGSTQEGSDTKLLISPADETSYRPQALTPTAADPPEIAIVGQEARFNCFFTAYPFPISISWNYARLEDIGRVTLEKFGSELVLSDVRDSDEGEITCSATNEAGTSDTAVVNIEVQSRPSFIDNWIPTDTTGVAGNSISFLCKVKAEPEAPIEWLVNALKINPNDPGPRRILDGGNFTFTQLCKVCPGGGTDLLVVQCRAENKHGVAYASGFLNVLEKTMITEAPEDVLLENKGVMEAKFTCKFTTDPSTTSDIYWKLGGRRLYAGSVFEEIIKTIDEGIELIVNLTGRSEETIFEYVSEPYRCIVNNGQPVGSSSYSADETEFFLEVKGVDPSAPPVTQGGIGDLWWVFVVIAAVLLLFICILCLVAHARRNRGEDYPVDEKERDAGYDPQKELEEDGFHDYQRPVDHGPVKGSRASLASSIDVYANYDDDDASLGEYGDGVDGKFNEDGSFIGRYTPDNKYGRETVA